MKEDSRLFTSISGSKVFEKLYSWEAPEREWSRKDRGWYVAYSLFFILVIAFAAILNEFIFIIAVIAFTFLWFTQAAIPPEIVEHTLTTLGVRTYGKIFKWKNIKHFWFGRRNGIMFLHFEIVDEETFNTTRIQRLSLIIHDEDEEKIFKILINYVDYGDRDEVGYNILTKMINGVYIDISKYLPEEYIEAEEKPKKKKSSGKKEKKN